MLPLYSLGCLEHLRHHRFNQGDRILSRIEKRALMKLYHELYKVKW